MTAPEFLKVAREKISSDPNSRLTPLAAAALADPSCVVDIHAHIFDKKSLTVWYVLLRMLKSKVLESLGLEITSPDPLLEKGEHEIYASIAATTEDHELNWEKLETELEAVIEVADEVEIMGFDLREALAVLRKKDQREVLEHYLGKFSLMQIPEFWGRPFVTGVLMMDLETGWDIQPKKKLAEQVDEIKAISEVHPIIPFFPVDPRRPDVYELFLKAFAEGDTQFFGVKCYPALGYLPSDARLDPIFEICAEKNIPVLTHCGGNIVSTYEKKIEVQNESGLFSFAIPGSSRVERATFLNNPANWDSVLEKHKNLKLNLAHFGGDNNWEEHARSGENARVAKVIQMVEDPELQVYTDFSFNLVEKELFDTFLNLIDSNPKVAEKVMYGTDYWVVLPAGDLLGRQKEFLSKVEPHQPRMLNENILRYLGIAQSVV